MGDLTQTVAALLVWIAGNTAYVDAAKMPQPTLIVGAATQMASVCATCAPGSPPGAIYQCDSRTLTVADDLVGQPDALKQFLVHELVHHAQCVTWRGFPRARECEAEREAYAVQASYTVSVYGDTPATRAHRERLAEIAEKACAASRR